MPSERFELIRFESAEALAADAASKWCAALGLESASGPPLAAALPGGRITKLFFAAAARVLSSDRPPALHRLHFFWGDERCVPPTDPESNFRLAQENLLRPLDVPEGRIHRIEGELDPATAALRASEELRRWVRCDAAGYPALDWVFLGMGEDGHVASLFPGATGEETAGEVYQPVTASKPPPRRITLSYGSIASAREVWVLASGGGKASALKASLSQAGGTPLHRVIKSRSRTRILTDLREDG